MRKWIALVSVGMLFFAGLLSVPEASASVTTKAFSPRYGTTSLEQIQMLLDTEEGQPCSSYSMETCPDPLTEGRPGGEDSQNAYTIVTWVNRGFTGCTTGLGRNTCRWMSVKCHYGNYWHILRRNWNSVRACGGTGWIERTWVDADVFLVYQNLANGNVGAYPPGCNCGMGGGNYAIWLNHV